LNLVIDPEILSGSARKLLFPSLKALQRALALAILSRCQRSRDAVGRHKTIFAQILRKNSDGQVHRHEQDNG